MPGASVETITGRLGVGSVCLLAIFLAIDGMQIGAFHLVETYGKSATFGIIAALPTAVVAYILGVFCVGTADLLFSRFTRFRDPDPVKVADVSRSAGSLLQQLYTEHLRNDELLKGASIAFLLLAVGIALDASNLRGYEPIVFLACVGAIVMSAMSLIFAQRSLAKAGGLLDGAAAETSNAP